MSEIAKQLLGMTQVGGKPKSVKKSNNKKMVKSIKPVKLLKPLTKTKRGGDIEYKCQACVPVRQLPLEPMPPVNAPPQQPPVQQMGMPPQQPVGNIPPLPPAMKPVEGFRQQLVAGGAKITKKALIAHYKKRLNDMTVEKLRKIAKNKKICILVKRNGKKEYVKKATLVRKICDHIVK